MPLALTGLLELDGACDRFEAMIRAGGTPELASFLAAAPESVRPQLFRELLILELGSRLDRGECPDAADYHERFPDRADAIGEVFALFAPADSTLLTERRRTPVDADSEDPSERARPAFEVADRVPRTAPGPSTGCERPGMRCSASWAGAGWGSCTWPAGSC